MSKICLCCGKPLKDGDNYRHSNCINKFFDSTILPTIDLDINKIIDNNVIDGVTVTGVQKKFSFSSTTKKRRKTLKALTNKYIIKTEQENIKNIVIYEWIGMKLASIVGIKTVPCGIIKNDNELLFITKRIDRSDNKKIPMEDFAQLSNTQTEYKYNGSYERCYMNVIKKYSSFETLDKIKFYKVILFSYIIGNTDMHLKNFSLYEVEDKYQLTPFYDLVPVLMVFNQEEMALTINGKRKNLTRNDFYSFASYMGINKELVIKIHNDIKSSFNAMVDFINAVELSEEEKKKFISFIKNRIEEVC